MALRISATAAGIQSLAAMIAKPDPSATTWSRLEPLPTGDDVSESLQAKVADPLWMLARQWQFNEFQGEDAGSPIEAQLRVSGVPITSLVGGTVPAVTLAGAAPIEAIVEREQVLAIRRHYKRHIVEDAARVITALQALGHKVYIISGGLAEPVREFGIYLGIPRQRIRAVDINYNELSGQWWEKSDVDDKRYLAHIKGALTISSGAAS